MIPMLLSLPLAPPPAVTSVAIQGRVHCDTCPSAPVHVYAFPETDRYRWPWWNVYGFLQAFHTPEQLDAIRAEPLAVASLDAPGRFRLELAAPESAHLFAVLDVTAQGPGHGPAALDWVGRFSRNPYLPASDGSADIILQPLIWSPSFDEQRWRPPTKAPHEIRFTDVTDAAGIGFRHCQGGDLGHLPTVVGSGAMLEDLDGDGDLDLVTVQGMGDCPGASPVTALYRNDGRGHFDDVTAESGLALRATGMGIVGADYDADGDIDLFITTYQGGKLLRNDGGLRFRDVTDASGLDGLGGWPVAASFGDVDGDRHLDLFIARYLTFSLTPPFTPDAEIPTFVPPMLSSPFAFPAESDVLFRNRGDGRFERTVEALGAHDPGGKGMATVLVDLDLDGDLDLFVTNDCTPDRLFENRGGRLIDVSRSAGVDDVASGMGIALGDVDGDGRPDIFSPHWMNEPSVLYRNRSDSDGLRFADHTIAANLAPSGNGLTGWAAELFDVDLDGDRDLLVSNGHTHPGRDPRQLEAQPLQLFLNDGSGRFADASAVFAALPARVWRGAALGDIDLDGDIDLYVVASNGPGHLLRNDSVTGSWLQLSLVGANGEFGSVGASVVVSVDDRRQIHQVTTGTGYLSHSSLAVEIGIGKATKVDVIEVNWPGGARQRFESPVRDRRVTLTEGADWPVAATSPSDHEPEP